MKSRIRNVFNVCVIAVAVLSVSMHENSAKAQGSPAPGLADFQVPTNAPTPADAAKALTNTPFTPLNAVSAILPYWDTTLTNSFSAGETFVSATPLWKTQTAVGSTPYLSTEGGYYFTKNFGVSGELVTFGNGDGTSLLDSEAILFHGRKDSGNVAIELMAGPSRDNARNKWGADIGGGITLRYKTGVDFFVDSRYRSEFDKQGLNKTDSSWLNRIGLRLNFR